MSAEYCVMRYDTAEALDGAPSADLVEKSLAAGDTGAAPAYRDDASVWQYVEPSMVDQYRRTRGLDIITVYVMEEA